FPRRINFGDVDGMVELNGFLALLEWKCKGKSIPKGQRIFHEVMTRQQKGNVVFYAFGDAESMELSSFRLMWNGRLGPSHDGDLTALKHRIREWADWTAADIAA
ncbi:MAG: hypothetical protein OXH59_18500, partial [Rhodospirillaceae bacterium]|nr:hypothetical protein [Rhodospirillaceae bacterium]